MAAIQPETNVGVQIRQCSTCLAELDPAVVICPGDGTLITTCLSQYEIISTIGSGSMGVVYKARQPFLNKLTAIKMLHLHLIAEQTAVLRFQRGAQTAVGLSHPHLVSMHDFGITEFGQPYMVMDYVEGKTLAELIAVEGPLEMPHFERIFTQLSDVLQYAHSRNVIHRDIKPSNLMLVNCGTEKESLKLLDFGIAKMSDSVDGLNLTRTGETIGSPLYMSPEQALGQQVDHRTDLYSVGCVMYESLTGKPPFVGKNIMDTMLKQLNDQPVPPQQIRNDIPANLETIVLKLLAKSPIDRYQTVQELQQALQSKQPVENHETGSHPTPQKKSKAPQPAAPVIFKGRHRATAVVLTVLIILTISALTPVILARLRVQQNAAPVQSGVPVEHLGHLFPSEEAFQSHLDQFERMVRNGHSVNRTRAKYQQELGY